VFGPLRRASTTEAGARGAAFLAGLAHGTYGSYDDIPNGARPDTARELQATTDHSL
jgi:glycerol kinase